MVTVQEGEPCLGCLQYLGVCSGCGVCGESVQAEQVSYYKGCNL